MNDQEQTVNKQGERGVIIAQGDKPPMDITTAVILDNPDLIKDFRSHAIVNRDHSSYNAAITSKLYRRSQKNDIEYLKTKIESLEKLLINIVAANKDAKP